MRGERGNGVETLRQAVDVALGQLEQRMLFAAGCTEIHDHELDHDDDGGDAHAGPTIFVDNTTFRKKGKTTALSGATFGSPLNSIPVLNSNSGASVNIFLDFTGDAAQQWGSYNVTTTPAYDQDGDVTSFSAGELANIQEIWRRVAESYSPFNVNVTTVDPGNLNNGETLKVVIGGAGAWLGAAAGGVAYLGSFANASPNVAWVFTSNLANGYAKYTADAAAHEAGHAFGLRHQSGYSGTRKIAEYRGGTALVAPIMGNSYSAARSLWSYGQTLTYSTYQDDLAVIAGSANGFGYRADDHGNTLGTAGSLTVSGASLSGSGVIERTSDVDAFSFVTEAGPVSFTVNVAGMLDATVQLVNLNGTVIASSNTASLNETVSATVPAGSYRLLVTSKAGYGDVGQYTVTGSFIPDPNYVAPPSNVTATSAAAGGATVSWYDNAWNETGYTLEKSADGGQTWTTIDLAANTYAYTDSAVTVGTTYQYRLLAYNETDQSTYSNTATVGVVPATPGGLTLTSVSASQINVAWADVLGEGGYVLERGTDTKPWATIATLGADTNSYSDTGLVAGTRYYYRIRATHAVGNSGVSAAVNTFTRTATPSLSLTVVSTGQINLSWTNVLGETGYRIERSLDGSTWSTLATPVTNAYAYANTGLTAGTQYWYRVVAVNAAGDSGASSANATTVLAAPTGLTTAGISTTQINLNWVDSTGETGYRIERSLDQRTWVLVANLAADTTSYSNTGLAGGTAYAYRVRALNAGGQSLPGATSVAVTVPLAPTLTAAAASDTQINLSWTNVSGETGYVVERSANGTDGWTTVASPVANAYLWNNTALTADTVYYYRITARNASGDSAASAVVGPRTLLPAVTGLTATGASTSQVDLSWNDSTGESGYRIERSLNGGYTWSLLTTLGADVTSYSNTGLAAGTAYAYRVRALNGGGMSLVAGAATAWTIPLNTTVTLAAAASNTQIRIHWLNVLGETGYRIERSADGSTGWTLLTTTAANAITYLDTGLTSDTPYFYRVTAFNGSGNAASSATATTRTLLPAPGGLTATAVSTSQVNLAWNDATGETGYVLERTPNNIQWYAIANLPADTTSYANTGLPAGTGYAYRVRATNAGGNSAPSTSAGATTIPTAANLNATAYSQTQINLSWTNVAGETGYRIERSTDNATWATLTTLNANVVSYANTGLTTDTLYYYRVTPFNAAGDAASTVFSRRTLLTPPTGVTATAVSPTQIRVDWDDAGAETGYKVEWFNGRIWTLLATTPANVTTFTQGGLAKGKAYYYRVRATNAGGDSFVSAQVGATTPLSAPVQAKAVKSAFQASRLIDDLSNAA